MIAVKSIRLLVRIFTATIARFDGSAAGVGMMASAIAISADINPDEL